MKNTIGKYNIELEELCKRTKELIYEGEYDKCEELLCQAMAKFPHAPHPHNLFGIMLEKKGQHSFAMNHFRAAWALDPTYSPANHNLNNYGSFFSKGRCAYSEQDVPPQPESNIQIVYDENGVGHFVKKKR